MSRTAHLMIEAKQAIMDEQLQRFLNLAREKHWEEAVKRLSATLASVADLLEEGAETLQALEPPGFEGPQNVSQGVDGSGRGSHDPSNGSRNAG